MPCGATALRRYFGLDHCVATWLGAPRLAHDAVMDAFHSMSLFNCYRSVQAQGGDALAQLQRKTLSTPPEPSFAKRHPTFEGCCMGNRKTCTCGAPFFG